MKVFPFRQDDGVFTQSNLRVGANLFITLVGVLMVLIGLYFAIKLFYRIFDALLYPEHIRELLVAWAQTMEWHVLEFDLQGKTLSFGRSFALVVLGIGGFLLVSIALAVIRTGARIIAFATEEREAIKDILQYSLGELWDSVHKQNGGTKQENGNER